MSISFLFWLIWLICLIFGGVGVFRAEANGRWYGGNLFVVWILLGLIGWKLFGAPIQ